MAKYNKKGVKAADPIFCDERNVIRAFSNKKKDKCSSDRCLKAKRTPPSPLSMKKGRKGKKQKKQGVTSTGGPGKPPQPKLKDPATDKTILTHDNYNGMQPYAYKVVPNEAKDPNDLQIDYNSIKVSEEFKAKFELNPHHKFNSSDNNDDNSPNADPSPIPTVKMISNLMLPNELITEICHQSNGYSLWRTKEPRTVIDPKTKREKPNP